MLSSKYENIFSAWLVHKIHGWGVQNLDPQVHYRRRILKKNTWNMVELPYIGLGSCNTSFKMLYSHWYQLISHKALVFFLLSRTCITASTSSIMTLPVISSNVFFQEVGYFENSTLSLFLRKEGLSSFRHLYKFKAWKMAIVMVIHDFRLLQHCEIFALLEHYAVQIGSHPCFTTNCWSHLQGSSSQTYAA